MTTRESGYTQSLSSPAPGFDTLDTGGYSWDMTRLALLLTFAVTGTVAVGKNKPLPPPPELPPPVVVSTANYDVSKFAKLRPHCDTSEKVARALNDQFHLGYDAKKKGDRRLIVVSGKRLEVRANAAEHDLIRRFLETGGAIAP